MEQGNFTPEVLLTRINETKINFDEGNWKHVSNEAKVRSFFTQAVFSNFRN
jgi:hypothetical protein